ncbi:MAG TPA: prepilin-type N-terminal cleavage/methylation domain-containing protein [Gemmataceae bacterium]|nr:prepilin-type N-terminal cleavage/methylation domain-containing protein [Gemmataceae bacterium]
MRRRGGFTLMETVLVLAILVIATAISVPVISSMLLDSHMDAGADLVRARLADTRAKALETGVPWKIAYLPGTGIIQFAAEDSTQWDNTSDQTPQEMPDFTRDVLPKNILLAKNRDDIASASGQVQPSGGWETLVIYTADGSGRDDGEVYIGAAGLMPLRMRVRGLTGAVTLDVPIVVRDQQ